MTKQITEIRAELLHSLMSRTRPLSIKNELLTLEYNHEDINCCLSTGIPENENDPETKQWRKIFAIWENAEGKWTADTKPKSRERRDLIFSKLSIEGTFLRDSLWNRIPLNEIKIGPSVISGNELHEDWVQASRFHKYGYWERYKNHLLITKNWDEDAVESVDTSTTRILNHLNDPAGYTLSRTKGLVVGYVQSGKTANYSALMAKAIDVGYRMIIVLSGRTDILRNQTQARLDMEVMGWESLEAGEKEAYELKSKKEGQNYKDKFIAGEIKPPSQPIFRLTKAQKDFNAGSIALKADIGSPCIAVLKKMPGRLTAFATILGKSDWRNKPVLIIDDEADDASVNTSKTSISPTPKLISNILNASDAAQYVGYTATPYANVFIRPDKVEELFPSDFVICLERPQYYMGALETFDIGDCEPSATERPNTTGNEEAHIRIITAKEMEETGILDGSPQLDKAIDSFILAGGVKRWRELHTGAKFTNHTMLINTDRLTDKHNDTAIEVEGRFKRLYPDNVLNNTSRERLEALWEKDFLHICRFRTDDNAIPPSFLKIEPFINITIKRVLDEGIRIVNCKNNDDTPDFDVPGGFWGILVGGSKLSRGYTIEGLTTTYFSRNPGQLDTLVQMARWYGYRKGYQDLVRLFIPEVLPRRTSKRGSTKNKGNDYRLLEAFRFGARVEEAFRNNLAEYSRTLKPEHIPPLVQYEFDDIPHNFSYLKPTSPNKKRYAKFITTKLGGVIRTATRIGGKNSRTENANQLTKYLDTCKNTWGERTLSFSGMENISAMTGVSTSKDYMKFIENLKYTDKVDSNVPIFIQKQIEALKNMESMPWRVIMYRRQKDPEVNVIQLSNNYTLPRWTRNYSLDNGTLSYDKPLDPGHRKISAWIAYHREGDGLSTSDLNTLSLRNKDCGITYIVPFCKKDQDDLFFLWCAIYPGKDSAGAYQVIKTTL